VTYRISYPSGKTFELTGTYLMADVGELRCPTIDSGERVHVLDQRAIITQDGVQVYHPRRNLDGLDPTLKKWLDENPEW
jgi:hypothetical protein